MRRSSHSHHHRRRSTPRRCRLACAILLGSLLPALATAAGTADGALQRPGALLDEAQQHIASAARAAYPDGRITVDMLPLDPRLELAPCDELEYRLPGPRISSRQSIHVRCHAPQAWGFYATGRVRIEAPVLTLTRSVPRNAVLQAADMEVRYNDVTALRDGYMSEADDAVGLTARHNLRAGTPLYLHQLTRPTLVSRGDTVTLSANRGQVTIRTRAVALGDGSYGERVDVRNPRSERTVTGWVTGHGQVSTTPGAPGLAAGPTARAAGAVGKLN